MKRLFVATQVAIIFLIASCGKTTCLNPGLRAVFSGYDTSELSRVVVAQYVTNTNFGTILGVRVYDTANTEIVQSSDTLYMPKIDTGGAVLAPGYDYIISVPSARRTFSAHTTFKVSDISYTQVKRKTSGNIGCTNDATYYLDTLPVKVSGGSFGHSNLSPVRIILNK